MRKIKLLALSIIILAAAVFTSSASAIIGPTLSINNPGGAVLSAAAPAFSPTDIASLEAMWETGSNDSTSKTESGGDLSQWNDISGNANHAIQNTLGS
jgi:hypothetical protein